MNQNRKPISSQAILSTTAGICRTSEIVLWATLVPLFFSVDIISEGVCDAFLRSLLEIMNLVAIISQ